MDIRKRSQRLPSSSLLPSLSDREAGSQGAGAALFVNGLRLRHVTQQQPLINNTASPGKWWHVLVKERKRKEEEPAAANASLRQRQRDALP